MGVIGAILVIVVSVIIVCGGGFFGVELGEDGAEDVCVAGAQAAQGGFGGASVAAAGLDDEHGVADDRGDEGSIGKTEHGRAVEDRKSVVQGKSVSVSVDLGGRRIVKKKKKLL